MNKKKYIDYETLPDGQFKTLVDIVCKEYNADPQMILTVKFGAESSEHCVVA